MQIGNRGLVEFHEIFSVYSTFSKKNIYYLYSNYYTKFSIINQIVIFF